MTDLPDGTYDCIVVDVEEFDDGTTRIDFTVTRGDRKGETLSLRARGLRSDAVSLLALPATIDVVDGAPRVSW